LDAQTAQLRTLLDTLPDLVWLKSPEGKYLACNRRLAELFGTDEKDIVGKTDEDFVSPDQAKAFRRNDRLAVEAGGPTKNEEIVTYIDGHQEYLETIKTPVYHEGRLLGVLGIGRDITERIRYLEQLKLSEERLRLALEATSDAVWDWDLVTGVIYRSPHWFSMLGYPEGHGTDDLTWARGLIHPEDRERVIEASRKAIETGGSYAVEARMLKVDGTWLWVHSRGQVSAFGPDGKSLRVSGINTDIHQRVVADAERAELRAQLLQSQKMESLGILAGGIAHDMNNVLGAILGMASAQIGQFPPDNELYRAFDHISQAAIRGGKLVRSLLNFARKSPVEEKFLDVNALLQDEVALLERTVLTRVKFETSFAADLPPVRGDGNALSGAVMNLCVNAVEATPETGTVTLRTALRHGQVEIQVQDTGTGMPPEVLARALDPFFTTKPVGKGTGLGLSLVYATVSAHNGTFDLQSRPGEGTTATMRFPAEAAEQEPALAGPPRSRNRHPSLHVLLVDDDPWIRESTRHILKALGHRVDLAASGEEALLLLDGGLWPDAIVLDMTMAGLGGAGTLPRIREMLPAVPVVLATGRSDQSASDLVAQFEGVILLPKPYGLDQLRKVLEPFQAPG